MQHVGWHGMACVCFCAWVARSISTSLFSARLPVSCILFSLSWTWFHGVVDGFGLRVLSVSHKACMAWKQRAWHAWHGRGHGMHFLCARVSPERLWHFALSWHGVACVNGVATKRQAAGERRGDVCGDAWRGWRAAERHGGDALLRYLLSLSLCFLLSTSGARATCTTSPAPERGGDRRVIDASREKALSSMRPPLPYTRLTRGGGGGAARRARISLLLSLTPRLLLLSLWRRACWRGDVACVA